MTNGTMFYGTENPNTDRRLVEVSESDVRAVRRLLSVLEGGLNDGAVDLRTPLPTKAVLDANQSALIVRARQDFENRRRRTRLFSASMFGEPAWDMLLALYVQHTSGPRLAVGRLLQFSGTPPSTGKRWLDVLVHYDLVVREAHPNDARTHFVRLTDKAREMLNAYFSETPDITP